MFYVFAWWRLCVCIQAACKSLVICYLCILHKCHLKGTCAHTQGHADTHTQSGSCCVLHEQVNQAPTSKSNTRAPPTASASSVPRPLVLRQPDELWENNSRRWLYTYSVQLISIPSIKFQSNLSLWTLVSGWGKANPDRANKAAAVWPCLAAWYNVSCDES